MTTQTITASSFTSFVNTQVEKVNYLDSDNKASINALVDQYISNVIAAEWDAKEKATVVHQLPPTLNFTQSTILLAERGFTIEKIEVVTIKKVGDYIKSMFTGKSYQPYLISVEK